MIVWILHSNTKHIKYVKSVSITRTSRERIKIYDLWIRNTNDVAADTFLNLKSYFLNLLCKAQDTYINFNKPTVLSLSKDKMIY